MVKGLFRRVLFITFLILIIGSKMFGFTLADAYNVLIGNGWTVKDALGFLGTSIAGTLAMNPSLGPAAAAAALSAYIVCRGTQLYDIYRDWRELRTGIAMLYPVQYRETMSARPLQNGEYGWSEVFVAVNKRDEIWEWSLAYKEYFNDKGYLRLGKNRGMFGSGSIDVLMQKLKEFGRFASSVIDIEGRSILNALLQTAFSNVTSENQFLVNYNRSVVVAQGNGVPSWYESTLGYRVNVDPVIISEEGVQYLSDPDAFYNWFLSNYMNGINEGSYMTPIDSEYDEIRSYLETIVNQLNNLSLGGGDYEETLNQVKTEIINIINTKFGDVGSDLDDVNTKVDGLNTKVDGLNSKLDDVNSKLDDVVSTVDTVTSEIEGFREEQEGFFESVMRWLNETLWDRLRDFLSGEWFIEFLKYLYHTLVVPEDYQQVWSDVVSGWKDAVSFEVDIGRKLNVTGDNVTDFSIPLGRWSIAVPLSSYIEMLGLRQLITTIVIASMWMGFLFLVVPRFVI